MKVEQLIIDECVYDIVIGQTQIENDMIIKKSQQNDLWFHLDKLSGPHIVLRSNGEDIPKKYLNYIGSLFPLYKRNIPKNYTVIYTTIKNVKLTKVPGQVIVSKTQLLRNF